MSAETTPEFIWATKCVECEDGPRVHDTEDEARESYAADAAYETLVPPEKRHTVALLRRPAEPVWETVTTTAWDGSRDAAPVDRDSAGSTDSGEQKEAASPAGEK